MKKSIIIRESRHIVAVFNKEHKSTGYCIRSNSKVAEAVNTLLKWRWAESVSRHDGFVFVKPTARLLQMSFNMSTAA